MAAATSASAAPHATLSARVAAYFIDSIALLIVVLVFVVVAGAVLLFSREGNEDPPDAAWNAFMAILVGGPMIFWSLLNLALLNWRAQTLGMFVANIKTASSDTPPLTAKQTAIRWFALHPLLYHPLLSVFWLLFAAYATAATLSRGVLALTLTFAFLGLLAPLAGFAAMALDKERRGLHDRLSGTRVVEAGSR